MQKCGLLFAFVALSMSTTLSFADTPTALPDVASVERDLAPPPPMLAATEPAPGKRVRLTLPDYADTEVHHALYLPTDWKKNAEKKYPVIVEYAGNGPYRNKFGDISTGKVEDCLMGYGISGGEKFLWLTLPYVSEDGKKNQTQWWGSVENTVAYCKAAVPKICADYHGDPDQVFLCGFSRGAIACNFIGLHDDEIAQLWRGFICHSHYDGVKKWNYENSDRDSAAVRLARLGDRPQFISHEGSIDATRNYLAEAMPQGNFTFAPLPYRNHTAEWLYQDILERRKLRAWLAALIE
jgi:hypothetical protein